MARLWVYLVLLVIMSGCVSSQTSGDAEDAPREVQADRIVIALIDTGTNPYLPIFSAVGSTPPSEWNATPLLLTMAGDYGSRMHTDDDTWRGLQPKTLYHVVGTRLLVISFDPDNANYTFPENGAHGAVTSYVAARDAPNAWILVVKVTARLDPLACKGQCYLDPADAEGYAWAADQAWIDIVTSSIVPFANPPDRSEVHREVGTWLNATETAARSGKVVISGANNGGLPTIYGYTAGPPWMIAVGGGYADKNAESIESAKGGVDVLSNWSVEGPAQYSVSESSWWGGTSFASPTIAGTLAHAMYLVKQDPRGRPTVTQDYRDALNATGIYFDRQAWDPTPYRNRSEMPTDMGRWLNLPILTQAQMGWGYVNASMAPEIARRVLEQDFTIPPGKDQAMIFQPAWQQAREDYWAQYRS